MHKKAHAGWTFILWGDSLTLVLDHCDRGTT